MLPVPAAASIRAQLYAVLEADVALVDPSSLKNYLKQGINSILPRRVLRDGKWVDLDPANNKEVMRPFIYVRFEGGAPLDLDNLERLVIALEVHDRPGYGLWTIDRILERGKVLFNRRRWERPTDSTGWARRSWWAGASGEVADAGYSTVKRIGRIQVFHS